MSFALALAVTAERMQLEILAMRSRGDARRVALVLTCTMAGRRVRIVTRHAH